MSSLRELLIDSHELQKALRAFYLELGSAFKSQVEEIAEQNQSLIMASSDPFPDFNFQFFEIDNANSTHFRIVARSGVMVAVLNEIQGSIGLVIQLHQNDELADVSYLYTLEKEADSFILFRVDSKSKSRCELEQIVTSALSELISPSIEPHRIKLQSRADES